jgi:isoleucyl-tRNA synthetase
VSQVVLDAPDGIIVEGAAGEKCERCWKYSEAVGSDVDFPTVCENCAPVLKEMLG